MQVGWRGHGPSPPPPCGLAEGREEGGREAASPEPSLPLFAPGAPPEEEAGQWSAASALGCSVLDAEDDGGGDIGRGSNVQHRRRDPPLANCC